MAFKNQLTLGSIPLGPTHRSAKKETNPLIETVESYLKRGGKVEVLPSPKFSAVSSRAAYETNRSSANARSY